MSDTLVQCSISEAKWLSVDCRPVLPAINIMLNDESCCHELDPHCWCSPDLEVGDDADKTLIIIHRDRVEDGAVRARHERCRLHTKRTSGAD